jgi:hypothetical protein
MHAQSYRVIDQAESCLVSPVHPTQKQDVKTWSNEALERGIVDLYARRMGSVRVTQADARQEALDRIVITQPFGRAFTAQPSFPPDPPEAQGSLAGLRKKLAGAAPGPRRKLATS